MDEGRNTMIKGLKEAIAAEEKALWQAEGQKYLLEAKRENIQLQLEAAYRERINSAYNIVNNFFINNLKKLHFYV